MKQKKTLSKNMAYNVFYNLLKMVFPLVTFPYANRILGVESLGKINFSISFVSYFTLVAALGISSYAIREGVKLRDKRKELDTFISELFTINTISTVIAILLLIISLLIVEKLNPYKYFILIYSITLLFNLIGLEWVNNIFEEFGYVVVRNFILQIISMILLFAFVRSRHDIITYLVISGLPTVGIGAINFFHIRRRVEIHFLFSSNLSCHIKPILTMFVASIATSIYMNLDTVMLGFISGDTSVGLYTAAVKVNRVVINMVAAANAVLLPRLSLSNKTASGRDLFSFDVFLSIPIGIGMAVVSEYTIQLLCGSEFMLATNAMRILSISFIFSSLNNCISNQYLIPMNFEKINMVGTIIGAMVNFLLNLILIPRNDYAGAAFTTLLSEAIVFLTFILYLKSNHINITHWIQFRYIGASMMFIPLFLAVDFLRFNYIIKMISCMLICAVVYFLVLYLIKDSVLKMITENLLHKLKKS